MRRPRPLAAVAAAALATALLTAPTLAAPGHGGPAHGSHARGHQAEYPHFRDRPRPRPVVHVPEIDAASGLAALAAICGALALAWERRRLG